MPVPVDSTTVMKAIWESLLLRGKETEQLAFDLGAATSHTLAEAVEVEWFNVAEREKASRSRFRQAGIKPAAVSKLLDEIRSALGGPADAEHFTRTALSLLGATIADTADGFTARTDTLPPEVRNQLPATKDHRLHFHRSLPVPPGHHVLTRVDPVVEALSRYVLDAALDPTLSALLRPGRRAAVARSSAVHKVTTLLWCATASKSPCPAPASTVTQSPRTPTSWPSPPPATTPLAAHQRGRPAAHHPAHRQRRRRTRRHPTDPRPAPPARPTLPPRATGRHQAEQLVAEHRDVRAGAASRRRDRDRRLLPPPDVLGVYVFLPDGGFR